MLGAVWALAAELEWIIGAEGRSGDSLAVEAVATAELMGLG